MITFSTFKFIRYLYLLKFGSQNLWKYCTLSTNHLQENCYQVEKGSNHNQSNLLKLSGFFSLFTCEAIHFSSVFAIIDCSQHLRYSTVNLLLEPSFILINIGVIFKCHVPCVLSLYVQLFFYTSHTWSIHRLNMFIFIMRFSVLWYSPPFWAILWVFL